MIISTRPWHLKLLKDNFAVLKDAQGKTIAIFTNWNDAAWLLHESNAPKKRGAVIAGATL